MQNACRAVIINPVFAASPATEDSAGLLTSFSFSFSFSAAFTSRFFYFGASSTSFSFFGDGFFAFCAGFKVFTFAAHSSFSSAFHLNDLHAGNSSTFVSFTFLGLGSSATFYSGTSAYFGSEISCPSIIFTSLLSLTTGSLLTLVLPSVFSAV